MSKLRLLKGTWLPAARMKRVIFHWTAGRYQATGHDLECYHFLVEGDGKVLVGVHSVKDNEKIAGPNYAAHTLGANSGSIGVTMCCMEGAKESPFRAGNFPTKKIQWNTLAKVIADLCDVYDLPVTNKTVLGHGEVQANLQKRQNGKWDPMVLPWAPGLACSEVGGMMRSLVLIELFSKPNPHPIQYPLVEIDLFGFLGSGIIANESAQIPLALAENAGFTSVAPSPNSITLKRGKLRRFLTITTIANGRFISAKELALDFGLTLVWQANPKKISLNQG